MPIQNPGGILSMGKKGRRAGKTGGDATAGDKAATKPKQGPGKARRERAAAQREIHARLDALIAKLDVELRDVELFGALEEREDCPICFVPMPLKRNERAHVRCCGKTACMACAFTSDRMGHNTCPFCRDPIVGFVGEAHKEVYDQQLRDRIELGDALAMEILAENFDLGMNGFQKDDVAAMRLWLRAAELGHLPGLCALARKYQTKFKNEGRPTFEQSMKFATAAAKKGSVEGHHILGKRELVVLAGMDETPLELERAEKLEKAVKHLEHAAIGGNVPSFELLQKLQDRGAGNMYLFLDNDTFDELEAKHKEALALEWSEERESYMAKKTKTS